MKTHANKGIRVYTWIRSVNYVVILEREKAREFYKAIQVLDSVDLRVTVDSPDHEYLGDAV